MARFRKKPVVIEAFQVLDRSDGEPRPAWFRHAFRMGIVFGHPEGFIIKTLEGDHLARWGDYIIQGVKGELYPCQPDIFQATYEEVA